MIGEILELWLKCVIALAVAGGIAIGVAVVLGIGWLAQ